MFGIEYDIVRSLLSCKKSMLNVFTLFYATTFEEQKLRNGSKIFFAAWHIEVRLFANSFIKATILSLNNKTVYILKAEIHFFFIASILEVRK